MKRTQGFFSRLAAMTGLAAASVELRGESLLRDIFSRVNNRVNGYEHVLARRRGKTYRGGGTGWRPEQRHGLRERMRRQTQMARRNGALRGRNVNTGETALLRITPGDRMVLVQMDRFDHPHSHGWHEHPARLWEVLSGSGWLQ